jgi:hypothetical protein
VERQNIPHTTDKPRTLVSCGSSNATFLWLKDYSTGIPIIPHVKLDVSGRKKHPLAE